MMNATASSTPKMKAAFRNRGCFSIADKSISRLTRLVWYSEPG
jgi:hypothetical protein